MKLSAPLVAAIFTALVAAGSGVAHAQPAVSAKKVFRYALNAAETGFDPAQISDLYSRTLARNIFDAPLTYDYLARPAKLRPNVAVALPEVSDDHRTFTIRLRPGIYFQDDPAFKGAKRELVAQDFVYAWKRIFDPRWKSPAYSGIAPSEILGTEELRKEALKTGRFDYDREIEGLRALDRYTFQVRLGKSDPRFVYNFSDPSQLGATAREVVEFYDKDIMAHPVGTGPYRLAEWKRSSKIVLERNPTYRDDFFDAEPPADDARSQAILKRLKGRKLPMVDRVEVSIIEESQPRWLSFLNAQHDMLEGIPPEFAQIAIPKGKLAPNLEKSGVQMDRIPLVDIVVTYFNMEDPVVGGYRPEKVALRRALSLSYDQQQEIRLIRKNQMIPASSPVPPLTFGYDPEFLTDAATYDVASARALLDTYGYIDRDGDGWRENPDGLPLELDYASQSDSLSRQYNELWKKSADSIGIRMKFTMGQWPDQLKASRNGKLMMWGVGWSASVPDSETFLGLAYTPYAPSQNPSRFSMKEFDALFDKQRALPDGPERLALMREMKRYFAAYTPYKLHGHRIRTDLTQPWVIGYRRHPFMRDFFKYIDIDPALQPTAM
jgi:ABC-type transport system substrate-binding protein